MIKNQKRETEERGNELLAGATASIVHVDGMIHKKTFEYSTFIPLLIAFCKYIDTLLDIS